MDNRPLNSLLLFTVPFCFICGVDLERKYPPHDPYICAPEISILHHQRWIYGISPLVRFAAGIVEGGVLGDGRGGRGVGAKLGGGIRHVLGWEYVVGWSKGLSERMGEGKMILSGFCCT
jgi:hypothetical protein